MKTKIFLPLAGVAVAAGLMSGCGGVVNSVQNAQPVGQRQMVSDLRAVTDASLDKKVSVVGVNQAMTPGGVLQVQVELLNLTHSSKNFDYRFEWFDANGMKVDSVASAVLSDSIDAGEDKMIQGVAPNPNCRDFRVKFYEAQ